MSWVFALTNHLNGGNVEAAKNLFNEHKGGENSHILQGILFVALSQGMCKGEMKQWVESVIGSDGNFSI